MRKPRNQRDMTHPSLAFAGVLLALMTGFGSSGVSAQTTSTPTATSTDDPESVSSVPEIRLRDHVANPTDARAAYTDALELRLERNEEAAVVDLLIDPIPGTDEMRIAAARILGLKWHADLEPSVRDLTRRLAWYTQIQRSIRPAPLDATLPIFLVMRALNAIDVAAKPREVFLLNSIAQQVSPNDPLWSGYRPSDQYLLLSAERLEDQGRFTDAIEIYRQLAIRDRERAAWFHRKLARAQKARVFEIERLAGADNALEAAARVRVTYLNAEEQQDWRVYTSRLQNIVNDHRLTRILPQTVMGELRLRPLPVAYRIPTEIYIAEGARLILEPGTMLSGGRLIVEGGEVQFSGTEKLPVRIFGVQFRSVDERGRGSVTGSHVHFRDCTWGRIPDGTTSMRSVWNMNHTYSINSSWFIDAHVDCSWRNGQFENCSVRVPSVLRLEPARVEASALDGSEPAIRFERCLFLDGAIDDVVPLVSTYCGFVDVDLGWRVMLSDSASMPADPIPGYFEPLGGLMTDINRRSGYVDEIGPVQFRALSDPPVMTLSEVVAWVY